VLVVDGVACELVFYRREPVVAILSLHSWSSSLKACYSTRRSAAGRTARYVVFPLAANP
jgi:hypothetical protein